MCWYTWSPLTLWVRRSTARRPRGYTPGISSFFEQAFSPMENKEIARLLSETADLMEIGGEDGFRIRSYRNAAAALESYPERIEDLVRNPDRKLTEIAGIGKGIAAVLVELVERGSFERRDEMLKRYPASAL